MKQDSKTDFLQWGSDLGTQHMTAFGEHRFLLLIIIPTTKLPGAHPTPPSHKMKATSRTE